MNALQYIPLSSERRAWLHDVSGSDARDAWDSATAGLSGLVSLLSDSYPRPLYFEGVDAEWAAVEEDVACLRGTPVHEPMAANLAGGRELWRMWEQEGHTRELHQLADMYLDALTADSLAVRHYPATPSVHTAGLPLEPRSRVAGAM